MERDEKERVADTQLHQILRMNGGDLGDKSYANNSFLQKKVMLRTKRILQEGVVELLYNKNFPSCVTLADMGCSSGPNTFLPLREIIEAIAETCCRRSNQKKPPVLQVFLNDLAGNDFNSIFRSLSGFYKELDQELERGGIGNCFVGAVPGSFHRRLFPPNSLHLVHSSYSLHWLSQVPKIPLHKENIFPSKASPIGVHKAYLEQFEKDFAEFLKSRSEEVICGGLMVLTVAGRYDNTDPSIKYKPIIWELFGTILTDMVSEGIIEESKFDSFNLPCYGASAEELRKVIEEEGSFKINKMETFEIGWDETIDDSYKDTIDKFTKGKYVADHLRSVGESILQRHFGGGEIIDVMFQRFSVLIADYMENESGAYNNHVVSLIKNF